LLTADKVNNTWTVKNTNDDQYLTYSTCNTTKYPSLYLRLNQTWFEIKPSTFILPRPNGIVGDYCPIAITTSTTADVILGLPFLKNYYMVFDIENDVIGIANHTLMKS
jgi:hypothetical protein